MSDNETRYLYVDVLPTDPRRRLFAMIPYFLQKAESAQAYECLCHLAEATRGLAIELRSAYSLGKFSVNKQDTPHALMSMMWCYETLTDTDGPRIPLKRCALSKMAVRAKELAIKACDALAKAEPGEPLLQVIADEAKKLSDDATVSAAEVRDMRRDELDRQPEIDWQPFAAIRRGAPWNSTEVLAAAGEVVNQGGDLSRVELGWVKGHEFVVRVRACRPDLSTPESKRC